MANADNVLSLSFNEVDFTLSVSKDLDLESHKINDMCWWALENVGSTMRESLKQHIHSDWYVKWGEPKVYKRRTDNPSLGTPLGSDENIITVVDPRTRTLTFGYRPKGEHQDAGWYSYDGDAIISMIEEGKSSPLWMFEPGEDQHQREIMPRPFWSNFLNEMQNGKIMEAFTEGFARGASKFGYPESPLYVQYGEKDIVFYPSDGELDV